MAKSNRGLPPDFALDIPDRPKPVDLGDYLDEVEAAPPKAVARPVAKDAPPSPAPPPAPAQGPTATPAPPAAPSKVVEMPRPLPESREPEERRDNGQEPGAARAPRPKRAFKVPPRRQINMSPETQRMVDELLDYVQAYSVQRDAKGSEVFHGLVLALYEAMEHIDLSNVPARGRWGTPTAQAFPISLKSAFQAAIAEHYNRKHRKR